MTVNAVLLSINHNNPDLELLRKVVADGEYIDSDGDKWNVSCNDTEALSKLDKDRINSRGYIMNNEADSSKYSCALGGLYWLRSRDFQDIELKYTFNDVKITFTHRHDLRTRVATRHGKPKDLSKYTKDVLKPTDSTKAKPAL